MSWATTILADAPAGWLRLGETAGTSGSGSVLDSSGNSRNATPVNGVTFGAAGLVTGDSDTAATIASGNLNTSVNAATAAQYLNWGNLSAWNFSGSFSLEMVASIPSPSSNVYGMLIAKSSGLGTAGYEVRFNSSSGQLQFVIVIGGVEYDIAASTTLSASTRYHIAATYDGSVAKLWVNGAVDGSLSISGTPTAATGEPLLVGLRGLVQSNGQYPISATVDEVAVYGTSIASRIAAHYTALTSGGGPGPANPFSQRRPHLVGASQPLIGGMSNA